MHALLFVPDRNHMMWAYIIVARVHKSYILLIVDM